MTESWTVFWTGLAAIAASAAVVVSIVYTRITYRILVAQAEPKVVVFVRADPDRDTILMIRIVNVGRDVATNVQFKAFRPIPAHAYGLSTNDAPAAEKMTSGPLIDGIPVLGPGDTRDITWGQFGGLMNAVGRDPIEINFTYCHGSRVLRGRSWLEVASFETTVDIESPSSQIARSLGEVSKSLKAIERDIHRPYQEKLVRLHHAREVIDRLPSEPTESSEQPDEPSANQKT